MTSFTTFLGIDQTGATDSKGTPKPLPVALVQKTSSGWKLTFSQKDGSRLELPQVTRENVLKLLMDHAHFGRDLSRTGLVMDSVFGLPAKNWPYSQGGSENLFSLFQKASAFSFQGKAYGRDAAEAFFKEFLGKNHKGDLLRRQCELESGANSVFLTRPFQRNIGCGTFRIWKELGAAPEKWFHVWGFEEPALHLQDGPWIFEAYPSLFWKKLLTLPSRQPELLVRWLKTESPWQRDFKASQLALLMEDPDLCDSVVLAIGARLLQERSEMWKIPDIPALDKEGWILGL